LTLSDKNSYALKYGIIYAIIIAFILLVPLLVYTQLVTNVNEAKNEVQLQNKSFEIISKMQTYNPTSKDSYFDFPRFNRFRSGLYDENFKPIFTLIKELPPMSKDGYYSYKQKRFYLHTLEKDKYFGAKYLIVENESKNYEIYRMALFIGLMILLMLFGISYFIFKQFALPFEKVNKALDNFMKDSMHEINTPLSIINVNVDLYERKHGENRHFTRIKSASKTLSNIYNDMDYLIKQNTLDYPKESIDIGEFLDERIDYFKVVASQREIWLNSKIEKDLVIDFNKTKLQRVIDNTLSNAIKYSYEKSSIDISLLSYDNSILFEVKDYGVGIEKPQMIFERYYRENLDKGGFGIGLNIVKKIIDEEGVLLKINSTPKKGSSFKYTFTKA
jgi:signal transduction histidine kinase